MPADRVSGRLGRPADQEPLASKAVLNALLPQAQPEGLTSLIEEFQYPKYGPGMMWERCAEHVEKRGGTVALQTRASRRCTARTAAAVAVDRRRRRTVERRVAADHVISSMPISHLVAGDGPARRRRRSSRPPTDLRYRDFLTVALVVPAGVQLPGQLDLHPRPPRSRSAGSRTSAPGRRTWSRTATCLGLEYFVNEGDELWNSPDEDLVALGTARAGAARPGPGRRGRGRLRGADAQGVPGLRRDLPAQRRRASAPGSRPRSPNVHPVGRNGMHRYNNQDHSMLTAHADRREHPRRHRPRRLGGQRRGGVPRGGGLRAATAPVGPRRCCPGSALSAEPARPARTRPVAGRGDHGPVGGIPDH